jgi:hypothetical protein
LLDLVRRRSDPYSNFLDPVPPASPDTCPVCRSARDRGFARCFGCQEAINMFGNEVADLVVPVALSVSGSQFAYELWSYKNARSADVRARLQGGLSAVLWRFLAGHERCIEAALGISFEVVTAVPSCNKRPGVHPLQQMVASRIRPTARRYRPLLVATDLPPQEHDYLRGRFTTAGRVDEPVLLIDDTWTRGSRAQAAAAVLKAAGAPTVVIVVLGRHFDPGYRDNGAFLRRHRRCHSFDWNRCCLET